MQTMKGHQDAPAPEAIARFRESLGMSQERFAEAVGEELAGIGVPGVSISYVTVSRWERGVSVPDPLRGAALLRMMDRTMPRRGKKKAAKKK